MDKYAYEDEKPTKTYKLPEDEVRKVRPYEYEYKGALYRFLFCDIGSKCFVCSKLKNL